VQKIIYPTLNANDISLRCIASVGPDGPWTGTLDYRINLSDSTVNGESLQIDRIDANGPKLGDILHPPNARMAWTGQCIRSGSVLAGPFERPSRCDL
jgi:hypothetical protein